MREDPEPPEVIGAVATGVETVVAAGVAAGVASGVDEETADELALRSAMVIPGGSWMLLGPKSQPTRVGSAPPRFWMNILPKSPLTSVMLELEAADPLLVVSAVLLLLVTLLIIYAPFRGGG